MTVSAFLIDNQNAVRDGIASLLHHQGGINVIGGVGTGVAGISETKRQHPDVVVLELNLPDLHGFEVMQRIQAAKSPPKVVVFSNQTDLAIVSQAFRSGARGYVSKSAPGVELISAIRAVLTGQLYLCTILRERGIDALTLAGWHTDTLYRLTAREQQVLRFIAEGKTSLEVAALVSVSAKSVDTYRARIKKKLGLDNMSDLVKFAIRSGLTTL